MIRLSVTIEAVGTATLVAADEVTGEVTAEASGTFYAYNWRSQTREAATKRIGAAAEAKADELAPQRAEALKFQAEEAARHALNERSDEAAEEARDTAERRLTLQAAELRPDLDVQAAQQLKAVQGETLTGIFQPIATGYSTALQAYAAKYSENL